MKGVFFNMLIGLWLMASSYFLNYERPASDNDRIVGPLVVSFAIIAFSETTRTINRWNVILGVWLFLSPMVLGYEDPSAAINSFLCGILIFLFSLSGKKRERSFNGGWTNAW